MKKKNKIQNLLSCHLKIKLNNIFYISGSNEVETFGIQAVEPVKIKLNQERKKK